MDGKREEVAVVDLEFGMEVNRLQQIPFVSGKNHADVWAMPRFQIVLASVRCD
jgi:hypothetical protein